MRETEQDAYMLATEPVRVVCIDYGVGFGGATKSQSLMLRGIPDVHPVIITAQEPSVRKLWYGQWRTYGFRRLCNYRTATLLEEKLVGVPALVRVTAKKLYALADAITEFVSAVQLALIARLHRAQILHFANGFTPPEALLAGRLAGIPTIAHLRGFFTHARYLKRFPPTLVIGDSKAVTASFIDAYGTGVPTLTLYEVVDVAEFDHFAEVREAHRRRLGLTPDHVAVGMFGRIVRWKGQKEFVTAMISAMQDNPHLVAVLVGDASDGGERYHDEVKSLIDDSGMRDRFRLTGYIEEVTPLYGAMDIVVHASIEPEPCGMVVMEGMAAGKPVVAADAGGPRELVRDGVDGYLVPPGEPARMASVILRLAATPEARARMGAAARRRARELYDVPVATERLRGIYRALASGDLHRIPVEDSDSPRRESHTHDCPSPTPHGEHIVDKNQILSRLHAFVEENFLYMRPDFELQNDQSLMGNGIVDSMGVMEMIQFLEEEFEVEVSDDDITEENLGSLNAIAAFVMNRRSDRGLRPG